MGNKREFLQLAQQYKGQSVPAWWVSEKLDGQRCFWDGGITRGMPTTFVPWANTTRDARYIVPTTATGLWSRYGKPIAAPASFIEALPDFPLDGELWMGRGNFQRVSSVVRRLVPDEIDWKSVQYKVFDAPSYREVFQDGEIRIKGKFEKVLSGCTEWCFKRVLSKEPWVLRGGRDFEEKHRALRTLIPRSMLHEQVQLPFNVTAATVELMKLLENIVSCGGEGLMVRRGGAYWVPKRVNTMLKVKNSLDDEGEVIGYYWGKETDLGSKYLGLMGSLIVRWKDKTFKLSGFEDEERKMTYLDGESAFEIGMKLPGLRVDERIHNPKFPIGTMITFQYRELTDDGIPKEARYLRIRED